MSTLPILIGVLAVLAYSLYRGLRSHKEDSTLDGFFIMNKKLHAKALGASFVGSNISIATVVLSLGVVGYTYGFWASVWLTLCWILGTLLFAWLLKKPRMISYLQTGHTLHEFLGECYDKPGTKPYVRLTASFLTLLVFWGALGIEFFAAIIVFTKLTGGPPPILAALIIAATVIIYTIKGGYRAATLADYPRLILVGLGFLILIIFAALRQRQASGNYLQNIVEANSLLNFDPIWAVAVFVSLVPFQLAGMDMWQRCVAAGGDIKRIRSGLYKSLPFCFLWLVPAYVGSVARSVGDAPANLNHVALNGLDYISIFVSEGWLKYLLQAVLYGSLVATMASVCDTLLMCMVFTFMYDIYGTFNKINYATLTEDQERHLLSRAKYWTGFLGFSALAVVLLGLYVASLYDLIIASFAVQIVLFWPVLFALIFPRKELSKYPVIACLGLLAGGLAAAVLVIVYLTSSQPNSAILNSAPIVAFFVTLPFYLFLLLIAPRRHRDKLNGSTEPN